MKWILVILAIETAMIWLFNGRKESKPEKRLKLCCPNCHIPFSDWFLWGRFGRYCYPCQHKMGSLSADAPLFSEEDGVWLMK